MSKMKKMIAIGTLILTMGVAVAPQVSAYSAVKSYYYDVNKYTKGHSNYHNYQYVDVPNWSRHYSSSRYFVYSGWNFTRYQHVNYFTGGF